MKAFRLVLSQESGFGLLLFKSIVKSKLLQVMPSSAQKYHLEFTSFGTTVTSFPSLQ